MRKNKNWNIHLLLHSIILKHTYQRDGNESQEEVGHILVSACPETSELCIMIFVRGEIPERNFRVMYEHFWEVLRFLKKNSE